MHAIFCGITLVGLFGDCLNIHTPKEITWGSLIEYIFDVHSISMYQDTNLKVDFSLKRTFPQLSKCHICVPHRQIIKDMYIL